MAGGIEHAVRDSLVELNAGAARLQGNLSVPGGAQGIVLFAHGSGSSRHSPRNRAVAQVLQQAGLATLLLDLLTVDEERLDRDNGQFRFDLELLAERLVSAHAWLARDSRTADLPSGYFGASTGAGAALVAAARRPENVFAVVSRGGRPDLAAVALPEVRAPTLLIVGGEDYPVIGMNQRALQELGCRDKQLVVIPGATHLFEEPGALEEVARLASAWFTRWVGSAP